jgi:hypothetical protein
MSKFEKFDRYGNRIEDHDNVLRDGEVLRVPMQFRDSVQRAIAENLDTLGLRDELCIADRRRGKTVQRDPRGRLMTTSEEEEIEEEEDHAMTDLSKHNMLDGESAAIAARFRAREFALKGLAPDGRPLTSDALEARSGVEKAYATMIDTMTNAWRTPAAPQVVGGSAHQPPMPVPDARPVYDMRAKDAAWKEMVQRQCNAWRTFGSE